MALAAAGAAAGLVSTGFAVGLASGALAAGAAAVGFVSTFFSGFADEGAHSFEFLQAPVIVLWWGKKDRRLFD